MPKRQRGYTFAVQHAPFFKLPAESRNTMYELAATDESQIGHHSRTSNYIYMPPLSPGCHQIREEYEAVYCEVAPRYALKVNVHISNFQRAGVRELIDTLPALAVPHTRTYLLLIFLTNKFTLANLITLYRSRRRDKKGRGVYMSEGEKALTSDTEIYFDPHTQDLDKCREAIVRLEQSGLLAEDIKEAFICAFDRYDLLVMPEEGIKRKRKRKSSSKAAASKVQKRRGEVIIKRKGK